MAKGELAVFPLISGSEEDVEVALINATFQVKDTVTYKFPHPEFGPWLINEIFEKQKIMANSQGLFKKKSFCSSCQAELNPDIQNREVMEFELKFKELNPFQTRIAIPSVECENCRKRNVIDSKGVYGFRIPEALLHAFQS